MIEDAKQEAVQISRILTELLDTARPKPPHFCLANIVGTAEHAVIFARQQVVTKRINIDVAVIDALPPVEHDPAQINQVLLNLLLNAIQSMDKPGTIRVSTLQRDDDASNIRVSDLGKGISRAICQTSSGPTSPQRAMAPGWAHHWPAAQWNRMAAPSPSRAQSERRQPSLSSLRSGDCTRKPPRQNPMARSATKKNGEPKGSQLYLLTRGIMVSAPPCT